MMEGGSEFDLSLTRYILKHIYGCRLDGRKLNEKKRCDIWRKIREGGDDIGSNAMIMSARYVRSIVESRWNHNEHGETRNFGRYVSLKCRFPYLMLYRKVSSKVLVDS